MKLKYQGSVKNIYEDKDDIVFEYTDQFSVFDWGSMPDKIGRKGEALCSMGKNLFNFIGMSDSWKKWNPPAALKGSPLYEEFCRDGAGHHYLEVIKSDSMRVKKVNVIEPKAIYQDGQMFLDYGDYKKTPVDTLVPLEVIFRFGVVEGSSFVKRADDEAYLKEIGIENGLPLGERIEVPIIEFTTKLEDSDRFLSYSQASELAGLIPYELKRLKEFAQLLAVRLRDFFGESNIDLVDGKFEFAFGSQEVGRTFILVDSIGPDELRLIYKGKQLSKEILRKFYRDTPWYEDVVQAKEKAKDEGVLDWKRYCKKPPACDPELLQKAEGVYTSLANLLSEKIEGIRVFQYAPSLDEIGDTL